MNKNLARIYTQIAEIDSKAAEQTTEFEKQIKDTRDEKRKMAEQLKDVITPSDYNRIKADIAKLDNTLEFLNIQKQRVANNFSDTEAAAIRSTLNKEHEKLLTDTAEQLNKLAGEAMKILQNYDREVEAMNFIGTRVDRIYPFQLMEIYAAVTDNRTITTEIVQSYYRKHQYWKATGLEPNI